MMTSAVLRGGYGSRGCASCSALPRRTYAAVKGRITSITTRNTPSSSSSASRAPSVDPASAKTTPAAASRHGMNPLRA